MTVFTISLKCVLLGNIFDFLECSLRLFLDVQPLTCLKLLEGIT